MSRLTEKIAKAKAEHPQKTIPKKGFVIFGYWEKGNKTKQTWIGRIVGFEETEKGIHAILDYNDIESEIAWTTEKGTGTPAGTKTFYLASGVYKAHIAHCDGREEWQTFAIDGDTKESLTWAQLLSIFEVAKDRAESAEGNG